MKIFLIREINMNKPILFVLLGIFFIISSGLSQTKKNAEISDSLFKKLSIDQFLYKNFSNSGLFIE